MALKNIQLAVVNTINRELGKFEVVVHSDDGNQVAVFPVTGEHNAIRLRTAIRELADSLSRVEVYSPGFRS